MSPKKTTPKKPEQGQPRGPLAPDGGDWARYPERKKGLDLEKAAELPEPTDEQWGKYHESQGVFPKGKK